MKKDLHPDYVDTTVTCTCGSTFTTRSTAKSGVINADVCSQCHPFYTGKQKILDTGGRVARFAPVLPTAVGPAFAFRRQHLSAAHLHTSLHTESAFRVCNSESAIPQSEFASEYRA